VSEQVSTIQRLYHNLGTIIRESQPGERLLSEPKLARQLGVSRATLREAMRSFETQGLIRRRQGSGTYVMQPSQVIESGLEVLESIERLAKRIGLDVSMGELRVENRSPSLDEAASLDLQAGSQVVVLSRIISAEDRPAAYLVDILPDDIVKPEELEPGFSGSVLDLLLSKGKYPLSSSRCEINAVQAPQEIARALGIQRGDVLLRFVSQLFTENGRNIDYSYSYFLPGYFRFHVVRRVGGL
jgi:GntR family transcriptional regulator